MITYYISGLKRQPKLQDLVDLGLGYAFDGSIVHNEIVNGQGPDGAEGRLICRAGRCTYDPTTQDWQPHDEIEDVWVGIPENYQPADFERPQMLESIPSILFDDKQWMIPVAKRWAEVDQIPTHSTALPTAAILEKDDEGNNVWVPGGIKERFKPLWELGEKVYSIWENGGGLSDDTLRDCVNALAFNYFVSATEVSRLQLIQFNGLWVWDSVLSKIINLPAFEEIKKKLDSGTHRPNSGPAA